MAKTNDIFIDLNDFIPIGHDNAISREYLAKKIGVNDRILRKMIEVSELPIINLGYGYFIPDMENEVDVCELNKYIAQERSRISSIVSRLERKFTDILLENDEPGLEM